VIKKIYLDWIAITMIILMAMILVGGYFFLQSEGRKCQSNPFIYGSAKMGNVSCSCFQWKNPSCPAKFSFDDNSFDAEIVNCGNGLVKMFDFLDMNITK
jgi:hypothetical protein